MCFSCIWCYITYLTLKFWRGSAEVCYELEQCVGGDEYHKRGPERENNRGLSSVSNRVRKQTEQMNIQDRQRDGVFGVKPVLASLLVPRTQCKVLGETTILEYGVNPLNCHSEYVRNTGVTPDPDS